MLIIFFGVRYNWHIVSLSMKKVEKFQGITWTKLYSQVTVCICVDGLICVCTGGLNQLVIDE